MSLAIFALMLWEPHLEGRNEQASIYEIYFKDPFLIYAYIASVSVFIALYQVFKLLSYIRHQRVFSPQAVLSLRKIKYCAIALILFILGAEVYFFIFQSSKGEDIAGGVAMGLLLLFVAVICGTAAVLFESIIQKGVDMKSENDLTV